MPVTLTNLQTSGPVHVPLASGVNVRLSPGATSQELPDVEVEGNAKIEKLLARGVIEVRQAGAERTRAEPEPTQAGPERTPAPRKKAAAKTAAAGKSADDTSDGS